MDSIWGGTGNDILYSYAYAGDAKLYGEEGADTLSLVRTATTI
jgi:Ca2+-binding RTX toxin-like protein